MDAKTEELRAAHDVLAEFYAERLAGALDQMPIDQAVLGLFCDLTLAAGLGSSVADVDVMVNLLDRPAVDVGTQRVEHRRLVAALAQPGQHMGADEPGAAGEQDAHQGSTCEAG